MSEREDRAWCIWNSNDFGGPVDAMIAFANEELGRAAKACDNIRDSMDELTGRGAYRAATAIRKMMEE